MTIGAVSLMVISGNLLMFVTALGDDELGAASTADALRPSTRGEASCVDEVHDQPNR